MTAEPPGGHGVHGEALDAGERVERDDGGPLPALQAVGGADGDTLDVAAAERRVHDGCRRVMRDDDRDVAGSRARLGRV